MCSGCHHYQNLLTSKLMMSLNSLTLSEFTFDKTIQLCGDRAGGQGNFDFAGLAELQTMKFVLLIGNLHSLEQPTDWRRFLRLLHLAKRLHKPVLLWNLLLTQNESLENPTSLELGTAIKTTKLQLLKLPQPIISVYDDVLGLDNEIVRVGWGDGTIIVLSDEEDVLKEQIMEGNNLHIVSKPSKLPKKISDLLDEYSRTNISELIAKRLERVQGTENS